MVDGGIPNGGRGVCSGLRWAPTDARDSQDSRVVARDVSVSVELDCSVVPTSAYFGSTWAEPRANLLAVVLAPRLGMWRARMQKRPFAAWRVFILLLCLFVPNYFVTEAMELDGSNDEDSEAEALCCNEKGAVQSQKLKDQPPIPRKHITSNILSDVWCISLSSLSRWTASARLRLYGGLRAASLRSFGGFHPQSPLAMFVARTDSPTIDPA